MSKSEEYELKIGRMHYSGLRKLWEDHNKDGFDESFWKKGKVLEYVVLRAFELDILASKGSDDEIKGGVSYPYDVFMTYCEGFGKPIEQIDGAVHVNELHALVECKDYNEDLKIKIDPLAKLRNQLARRHGSVFGMFFSATEFTEPAEILVGHMAPQLIILWSREDIEFCLQNECFVPCMKEKYKQAIEVCEYNYPFWLKNKDVFEKLVSKPLF